MKAIKRQKKTIIQLQYGVGTKHLIFAMEEAAKIYQEDHQGVKIDIVEVGDVWNAYVAVLICTLPTALERV